MTLHPGRTDWTHERSVGILWELNHVCPDHRLVTPYIELFVIQTNFPLYLSSLQAQCEENGKQTVIYQSITYNFQFRHNRWHKRSIFICPKCLKLPAETCLPASNYRLSICRSCWDLCSPVGTHPSLSAV
jgi:hypothetical protein